MTPRLEGCLGENGYIYVYGWVSLLFTWNYDNIVNRLYPNIQQKVKKKKKTWMINIPEQQHSLALFEDENRDENTYSQSRGILIAKGL